MASKKVIGVVRKVNDATGAIEFHPYDVKTTGKHPVHMIDGGSVFTEEDGDFGAGDMGWFWLNSKEFNQYKKEAKEITVRL